jgi:pyruvate, orthophosphate dikinase
MHPGPVRADTADVGRRKARAMGGEQTTSARWVVPFTAGRRDQRDLLGGKGANLCEMTWLGLPVPPGFVITTDACRRFRAEGRMPDGVMDEMREALARLEEQTGRRLGDPSSPLLLSVRSGAPFSMPGMMDTVLDLGATAETADGLAALGGEWFAWDARRRFLEMFGRVVLGVDDELFGKALADAIAEAGVEDERSLPIEAMRGIAARFETVIDDAGQRLPDDPHEQLELAIEAVFRSWDGARARAYRRIEGIDDDLGTAVNIQMMVFGNLDDDSATGVAFTRDPATGEKVPYGDFLVGAQGEDVVAGTRHPLPLAEMADLFPDAHAELLRHLDVLEQHERDMCDIEFTIESGTLWMLQTRIGKRSAAAAVRTAVEMVDEGLIDEATAVTRIRPEQVEQLLHPRFADRPEQVFTTGLGASPGAAVGAVRLSTEDARDRGRAGEKVILVRTETSPEDVEGMAASAGLLTARGGLVSHAAVVARGLGIPAVCGARDLEIDGASGEVRVGGTVVRDGDLISIDGTTGEVVVGEMALVAPTDDVWLERILAFADAHRRLHVFANADSAADARRALEAGAEGIGLCRTEHQFLGDRLPLIQRVILATTEEEETEALRPLEEAQRSDFVELLRVMDGRTTVIRLLDPPLHEFLPAHDDPDADPALAAEADRLREHNPMLGTRGLRLGVVRPALYRAQIRAILGAARELREAGGDPRPEIMLPLVSSPGELAWGVRMIEEVAAEVLEGVDVHWTTATMMETPRAALVAAELAPMVDAFSYGTNDLTQLTFGFSRDDVGTTYIPKAVEAGVLGQDPFATLDPDGVGKLVASSLAAAREVKPDLIGGVCGEHGGEPASIALFDAYGLDHVSCSPGRLKVARLAAARSALGVEGPDRTA